MNYKLSIGIPVFNEEQFISETLKSILAQNYRNFELIIIDNNSSDDTYKILKSFENKDSRVKIYKNNTNIGMFNNFNLAFEMAKGDFFMWAGAHDILDPNYLTHMFLKREELDNDPDLIFSNVAHIDEIGESIEGFKSVGFTCNSNKIGSNFRLPWIIKGSGDMVYGIFKRETLERSGRFSRVMWADVLLIHELSFRGTIERLDSPLRKRRYKSEEDNFRPKNWTEKYKERTERYRKNSQKNITWDLYFPNIVMFLQIIFHLGIKHNYFNFIRFAMSLYVATVFLWKHKRATLIDFEVLFKKIL